MSPGGWWVGRSRVRETGTDIQLESQGGVQKKCFKEMLTAFFLNVIRTLTHGSKKLNKRQVR